MPKQRWTIEHLARAIWLIRLLAPLISFIILVALTLCLHHWSCVNFNESRYWIELFNGATWPSNEVWVKANCPSWPFVFVLALKMLITCGAIVVLFWLPTEYFVRKKRHAMNALQMLQSRQEAALSAVRIALRDSPDREIALKAIRDAGEDWDAAYSKILLSGKALSTLPVDAN